MQPLWEPLSNGVGTDDDRGKCPEDIPQQPEPEVGPLRPTLALCVLLIEHPGQGLRLFWSDFIQPGLAKGLLVQLAELLMFQDDLALHLLRDLGGLSIVRSRASA